MAAVKGEPILIRCEGSDCPGNRLPTPFGFVFHCTMCHAPFDAEPIPGHSRDDILARIDRGDFG